MCAKKTLPKTNRKCCWPNIFPFFKKTKNEKQKQNQCKIGVLLFHQEAISVQKSEPLQDTGIPRDFDWVYGIVQSKIFLKIT